MPEAVETIEGWYALHDFRHINWEKIRQLSPASRQEAIQELAREIEKYRSVAADQGSFGLFQVIGHKADVLFLHFRPSVDALLTLETDFNQLRLGSAFPQSYSYFSVVELSKYLARGLTGEAMRTALRPRLEPQIPDRDYVCFYPMNKKREGQDNWYMLSQDERRELMKGHGMIGHKYHEEVIQIITGSQGLDDWEWGVTLFSNDVLGFKKLIYEMRFDEASARFAEFGPFLIGKRIAPEAFIQGLEAGAMDAP
ncbi:putative heme peroxidase [Sulfobacillus acidophilus TPY]|uniref:Coproheme decarboxylase n=1 Tax=Sulfobacillus acidophilus (strain ATCC 700253 / DSM 10332 / NAL) TaxID=679936 RepID=G8TSE3_SULAD|nr:putative heme peroxidase [Sulfobacillus acidophilus TPY]AEW05555.1 Chlorite dismutase [Sulfobacillus acidophilus DSM 10332]